MPRITQLVSSIATLKSLKIPNLMLLFTLLPMLLVRKHQVGKWLAKKDIPGRGDSLGELERVGQK